MKKIPIFVNFFPALIWIAWFLCALYDIEVRPDLGMIQILLLLLLPLIYSLYNLIMSSRKRNFIILNGLFLISQLMGYYISGSLYFRYVSSDSETLLVMNTFSFLSLIYIMIITLAFYGIKALISKYKK